MTAPLFFAGEKLFADSMNDRIAHVIARAQRTDSSPGTTSATGVGVTSLTVDVLAGHRYRVDIPLCHATSTTNGDLTLVKVTHSVNGSTPTASSPAILGAQAVAAPHPTAPFPVVGFITPNADLTLKLLVCVARVGGSGTSSIFGDGIRVMDLLVWDMGIDPGNTGTNL
ncbi:hypothetical protein LWC34_38820 [Kibdelosporangium philippinense]|uniref:Uncharacterized protein n=1 Tax=Kibdelosporangium philippinense TaxID=211113 RepID=A0ABS8ZLP6_9PSEU|nr:hypothetical protein [Kibdelosporangium philippinense]MCE7008723.1 hypothetical protein [Kibdelosporangium philippinense]